MFPYYGSKQRALHGNVAGSTLTMSKFKLTEFLPGSTNSIETRISGQLLCFVLGWTWHSNLIGLSLERGQLKSPFGASNFLGDNPEGLN